MHTRLGQQTHQGIKQRCKRGRRKYLFAFFSRVLFPLRQIIFTPWGFDSHLENTQSLFVPTCLPGGRTGRAALRNEGENQWPRAAFQREKRNRSEEQGRRAKVLQGREEESSRARIPGHYPSKPAHSNLEQHHIPPDSKGPAWPQNPFLSSQLKFTYKHHLARISLAQQIPGNF